MSRSRQRTPHDSLLYSLYPDPAFNLPSPPNLHQHLTQLTVQCLNPILPYIHGYIWQHEPFNLAAPSTASCVCNSEPKAQDGLEWEICTQSLASSSSVAHLHGKVKFGDNVEDEWFVVFLLYEISRHVPNLSIRVWDSDGEFLLIEAAYHIPQWLKPENSWNRVFIRQGLLHILPLPSSPAELYQLPVNPSIEDALRVLSLNIVDTRAAAAVERVIQRRLAGYPEKAQKNLHNVRCRVPLPVAQILKHEPQLISLAVEAFYDRDMDSMKAASKMEKFLPNGQVEMVDIVIRMSRAMYGQLVQQVFQAPRCYPMPPFSDPHFKDAELGMKITCGFEMLYWERSRYDACLEPNVDQKSGMQKEKVASTDVAWHAFRASLEQSGYFKNLVEGSKEYRQLMDAAITSYRQTELFTRMSLSMHGPIKRINEILSLPHEAGDFVGKQALHGDDDSWLYNGEEDLTNAMLERQREIEAYESRRARKKDAMLCAENLDESMAARDFSPEDVVKSMQAFVNKLSSFEGAEVPGARDKHAGKEEPVSIDMDRFLKELKSAIGSDDLLQQEGNLLEDMETSSSDVDFDDDDTQDDITEDWNHASISDGTVDGKSKEDNKKTDNVFMDEYSDTLSQQLHHSTLAKTFALAGKGPTFETSKGVAKDEGLPPVNVDANLIQSLLESYSLQQGLPGPASNLLGAMGIHLPDDSKEERDTLRK